MLDFNAIRAVVSDMDGVLWRGPETLPGVPAFFHFLGEHTIPYALATNNSTKSVQEYVERLGKLGVAAQAAQIISSVVVTGDYMAKHFAPGTPIYVIGSQALQTAMLDLGYVVNPDAAQAVIVGLDDKLTYDKLRIGGQRILAGAAFIGTNADASLPVPGGLLVPGSGSIIAALQTMTRRPPLLMGKPQPTMFLTACERLGVSPAHTLMIGDRPETDILGAQQVGMHTALVLTGVADETDAEAHQGAPPGAVFDSLADLLAQWRGALAVR
jgi:4-nitrophenyl phosphatase